jgi:hypothetical protein
MGETVRYDKEEDRANDIKRHDNPSHPSKWGNLKRLQGAKEEQKEWQRGDYREP